MPAKPSNADLQRQIYSVQTEMRSGTSELKASVKEMSAKLDKALEHSAAHKARLDAHDKSIEGNGKAIVEERQARETQGMWSLGAIGGAALALILAVVGWLKEIWTAKGG